MQQKQKLGKYGEDLACGYLKKKGFEIIERNYHCQEGEVDIVSRLKDEYYFIEVKTRTSINYGYPEEAFDEEKKQRTCQAVYDYLYKKELDVESWQLGLICVMLQGGKAKIKFIIC